MRNKKGNLEMITFGVITLALMAVILVFGLIMLDELYTTVSDTSGTGINITYTTVTELDTIPANASLCGFHNMVVRNCMNATGTNTINSANYTTNSRTGSIISTAIVAAPLNNTDWNCTIDFLYGNTEVCEATNKTIAGSSKFANYTDLIVLAIVITVIISLLLVIIGTRKIQ